MSGARRARSDPDRLNSIQDLVASPLTSPQPLVPLVHAATGWAQERRFEPSYHHDVPSHPPPPPSRRPQARQLAGDRHHPGPPAGDGGPGEGGGGEEEREARAVAAAREAVGSEGTWACLEEGLVVGGTSLSQALGRWSRRYDRSLTAQQVSRAGRYVCGLAGPGRGRVSLGAG